jgi:HTH-type transcriptional regulator / antitoxin HipB
VRKQFGFTQSQVAYASGVGLRFMVELEAGKLTQRLDKARHIIDASAASCSSGWWGGCPLWTLTTRE